MDLRLTGKTAVVTGAGRGLGLAITRQLVAEGVRVVGASRTVTAELEEVGAHPVAADLSTPEGAEELGSQALAHLGGVDILVNNLGGGDAFAFGGFLATDDHLWAHSFEVNLFGTVRVTRHLLPSIVERRGTVLNISSMTARLPGTGPVEYAAAKAGLNAFGKALAEEFGPRGVRVNTVTPGPTRTGLWEDENGFGARLAEAQGVEHRAFLAGVPAAMGLTTGRMVEPEEVAAVVAFLASDRAASVTGADYVVEGGGIKTV
ncbi:oxidoreductase [Streptomyces showdoensis]|uniref:3-oxoacyl-ACP reductase n=1 Tax=Streptomyces showdoensis TaxID=68268 RepID=A0A2P2GPT1_STREW|nr:oxidoreductase [Streptomyces showdoensis]KKZ73507.1 3-oxoacyl-ACP reductase [Streptomyces showdoensis]